MGTIDGNKLYYNDSIYVETYENIEVDAGRCLGEVTWEDDGEKSKIYKVKGRPEYLYDKMFLDHRLYKKP